MTLKKYKNKRKYLHNLLNFLLIFKNTRNKTFDKNTIYIKKIFFMNFLFIIYIIMICFIIINFNFMK